LKFLLDEMYSAAIAKALRARRRDVVAVVEREVLRGVSDPELFEAAQTEGRAIVTENVRDFAPLASGYDARGEAHHGLVLVPPSKYPRANPRTVGKMVAALEALAGNHESDVPTSLRTWL
jgi:hypothetical protein